MAVMSNATIPILSFILMSLAFSSDLFEQDFLLLLQVVKELYRRVEHVRIFFETSSQFFGSGIIKKRNVLVEIRHDQLVTELLVMVHLVQAAPNDRFELRSEEHTSELQSRFGI